MLTLSPNGKKTQIIYRSRESRFSPDFFKGLGCATLFHVLLFSFLRVSSPLPSDDLSLLPFTKVVAELGERSSAVFALPHEFFIATFEEVVPHMVPDYLPELSFASKYGDHAIEPDFSSLEKIPFSAWSEEDF